MSAGGSAASFLDGLDAPDAIGNDNNKHQRYGDAEVRQAQVRLASKEVYERSEVLQLCGSNQESSVAILDWADKNNDIAERCNVAAASLELVYSLLFRLNNQYVLPLMVIGVSVLMLQGHVTEMVWGVLLALHLVRNKQWTGEFCRDISEALKSSDNSREAAVRVVCYDYCAHAQKTAFQHADRCVPRAPRCAVDAAAWHCGAGSMFGAVNEWCVSLFYTPTFFGRTGRLRCFPHVSRATYVPRVVGGGTCGQGRRGLYSPAPKVSGKRA